MNLNNFFKPKSIALIGATNRKNSVGLAIVRNLMLGKDRRKVFFINPYRKRILDRKVYSKITDIEERIDLAIIAVPAPIVLKVAKDCVQKKVGAVLIISSGFAETGQVGAKQQRDVSKVLKKADIPLVGPNCLGIIRPCLKLNASFAPALPKKGKVAFLSQSGALIDSIIDRSLSEDYGFSALVSYGNEADVDICDFLKFFAKDKETKVLALYLEGLKQGQEFINVAQKVSANKPIVVLKGGKTIAGRKAVVSHTGSLAGTQEIYSVAFKKAGILEVETINELLNISLALAWQPICQGRVGIITNGGACGVMAADWCEKFGVRANKPLDILGDASSKDYERALEKVLKQKSIGGVIVIQTLQAVTEVEKNAKIIVNMRRKWFKKPIVCCFMGGKYSQIGIKILRNNKIPNYSEPQQAVLAIRALCLKKTKNF